MAIVVCKKYRLLEQSGGNFKVTEHKKLIRGSVKIDELDVKKANNVSKSSGIYYEIDKEATEKRNGKGQPDEKEQLLAEAKELGIDVDKRTGVEKLKLLIEEAKSEQ